MIAEIAVVVAVVVARCVVEVHLKSQFIMNGVCVIWRGWIDLLRLDGTARLEFDEQRASVRYVTYTTLNCPEQTVDTSLGSSLDTSQWHCFSLVGYCRLAHRVITNS